MFNISRCGQITRAEEFKMALTTNDWPTKRAWSGEVVIDLRQARVELRDTPTVSVIVPTMNEAANLPHVLPLIPLWVDEVIIVDAGSTDGTAEVALELLPDAIVLTELRKGKGRALCTGFENATGDFIVAMDADGSTDPRERFPPMSVHWSQVPISPKVHVSCKVAAPTTWNCIATSATSCSPSRSTGSSRAATATFVTATSHSAVMHCRHSFAQPTT